METRRLVYIFLGKPYFVGSKYLLIEQVELMGGKNELPFNLSMFGSILNNMLCTTSFRSITNPLIFRGKDM